MNAGTSLSESATFEEGLSVDEVSPVGKAGPTWAQQVVLLTASLWALVTLGAPAHANRAAASIHAVPSGHGSSAALVFMGQVTMLSPQI